MKVSASANTAGALNRPVTVGLDFVLDMTGSISRSIKLFSAAEPAMIRPDPPNAKKSTSRLCKKR